MTKFNEPKLQTHSLFKVLEFDFRAKREERIDRLQTPSLREDVLNSDPLPQDPLQIQTIYTASHSAPQDPPESR